MCGNGFENLKVSFAIILHNEKSHSIFEIDPPKREIVLFCERSDMWRIYVFVCLVKATEKFDRCLE